MREEVEEDVGMVVVLGIGLEGKAKPAVRNPFVGGARGVGGECREEDPVKRIADFRAVRF